MKLPVFKDIIGFCWILTSSGKVSCLGSVHFEPVISINFYVYLYVYRK